MQPRAVSSFAAEPLRHLGALAWLLFWLLATSGLYLYARFDTSLAGAYDSIGRMEWWFGGLLRGLHRYAADAFVVVTLAHLARELLAGRFRGLHAFSWISGLPLLLLLYGSGLVGYWLVWDARAQFSALATAEWAQALGIGAEPMARNFLAAERVPDRVFSLFVFLHVGLPLALLAGMWVHVQRLGRPATRAPRTLALGLVAGLLALAALRPAGSGPRWDPARMPAELAIDWLYQFIHPLMYASSAGTLTWLLAGTTLALAGLAFLPRDAAAAARVDPANCNGCGRCVADCPYEAVHIGPQLMAEVLADRCAACGICAGACPSSTPFRRVRELVSGIELPALTMDTLRVRVKAVLARHPERLLFRCERAAPAADADSVTLRCLAMLPPAFIEYALRHGARRVEAAGCEAECAYRLGLALAAERFTRQREPGLRATVHATRIDNEYSFTLR